MVLTKKQELYTEAIILLAHICDIVNDKSEYISTICLSNYMDKLALTADSLERTLKTIENFKCEKKYDEDGIFNLFSSIKDYFEYYIRL